MLNRKGEHHCGWCGNDIPKLGGKRRAYCNSSCIEEMLRDTHVRRAAGERVYEEQNLLYGQLRAYRRAENRPPNRSLRRSRVYRALEARS